MTERSVGPERVIEQFSESMPGKVGPVFADLWNDVVTLQATWEIFTDLFESTRETLDLLNEVSLPFFKLVRLTLLHELQMLLSRLTDPAFSGRDKKQHNVSIKRLLHEIEATGDNEFATQISPKIEDLVTRCKPIQNIRHKMVAHTDFHIALKLAPPLPGVTRQQLEDLVNGMTAIMNEVEHHYRNSTTIYRRTVAVDAVNHLTFYLQHAREDFRLLRDRRS